MTKDMKIYNGERKVSSINVRKMDSHMQKSETEPLSDTIYKNELQMDQRLKYKT